MLNITERIGEQIQKQLDASPAQRLIDKLLPIPSKSLEMSRRWFWELLQNASDITDAVSVKVLIEEDFLVFEHDGGPFRIIDALNLIAPDTGKDENPNPTIRQIGKFGSGQVSTHVLSGVLDVEGIVKEEGEYYQFQFRLDRTDYRNKNFLIESIKKSRENFKPEKLEDEYSNTRFLTRFKYHLNKPLAGIDSREVVREGLMNILNLIPFTMTFLPKVNSVTIENRSQFFSDFQNFWIGERKEENDRVSYNLKFDSDAKPKKVELIRLKSGEVETAVLIDENDISAYPANMPKYFCGLPLIGTEGLGLPIPINSFSFETTQEREAVELSPQDKKNRELLKSASQLYKALLSKCKDLGFKKVYFLTKIHGAYLGAEASKIAFKQDIVLAFKEALNQSEVIWNRNQTWIRFSDFLIPYRRGQEKLMFDVVKSFKPNLTCVDADYESWLEGVDPELFAANRYGYDRFMNEFIQYTNLSSFLLEKEVDPKTWLKSVISLVNEVDSSHFKKFKLFPNQQSELCGLEDLFFSKGLPEKLIQIHDDLTGTKLGQSILDSGFDEFHSLFSESKRMDEKSLCKLIDRALQKKYSESQNNTALIIGPLRSIFSWCEVSNYSRDVLKENFEWFEKKRAVLFLETFDDKERDFALSVSQSGKLEALAKLAQTSLTSEQLLKLAENPSLLHQLLNGGAQIIDDVTFANQETGDQGEEYVFADLQKKFPVGLGYQVLWASKETGEGRFDFEIKKDNETLWFIDAKSTGAKYGSSGSIPFFMRDSQWSFLSDNSCSNRYVIARVSLSPAISIKYLKIDLIKNLNL